MGERDKHAPRERVAIDVERLLVWAYRDQRVDANDIGGAMLGSMGYPSQGSGAGIGMTVDSSGYVNNAVDDDAFTVHLAVLASGSVKLLIHHGLTATRPDWIADDRPRLYPLLGLSGRPLVCDAAADIEVAKPRDGKGERGLKRWSAQYCPLVARPTPESVRVARANYRDWYAGLVEVAGRLGKLGCKRHAVTGPLAPATPWLDRSRAKVDKGTVTVRCA